MGARRQIGNHQHCRGDVFRLQHSGAVFGGHGCGAMGENGRVDFTGTNGRYADAFRTTSLATAVESAVMANFEAE